MLPALACQKLVMSETRDEKTRLIKAKIGDIHRGRIAWTHDEEKYYKELAEDKGLGDLVARMIDKDLPLKMATMNDGATFFLSPQSIAS